MVKLPALQSFIDDGWITDVLDPLKSGKEATAYLCKADSSCGYDLLVAKVYKNLEQRGFRNDAAYREGVYITESRLRRAVRNKSRFGRQVGFGLWLDNEYNTLQTLHTAGAAVPKPLAMSGDAILMEYVGDTNGPAPQLNKVNLDKAEAQVLYEHTIAEIKLWLSNYVVHADLSPFNILYWDGNIKVIDFPQAVDARWNSQAYMFLQRDIENVCKYFQKYGVGGEAWRIANTLWDQHLNGHLFPTSLI